MKQGHLKLFLIVSLFEIVKSINLAIKKENKGILIECQNLLKIFTY